MWSAPSARRRFFSRRTASLPPLKEGDLVALMSAGAYGFVMASNYNSGRSRRRFW